MLLFVALFAVHTLRISLRGSSSASKVGTLSNSGAGDAACQIEDLRSIAGWSTSFLGIYKELVRLVLC